MAIPQSIGARPPAFVGKAESGYTSGMKIAVFISNTILREVDRFAKRTKRSRSRVFSDAVREYLARHSSDDVTAAMDRALTGIEPVEDEFADASARRTLQRTEW